MYLEKVERITQNLLAKYPEPDLKTGKANGNYYKKWIEHYIIAKTLMQCYDLLDTDPEDVFFQELLNYWLAFTKTDSLQKKKVYSIYVDTLQNAYDYIYSKEKTL